jgi:hypothetical protein
VLGKGAVGPGEGEDRLVGAADRTLRHRLRVGPGSLQERGHLVEARDNEPLVLVGGFVGNLHVNRGVFQPAGAQDLHGSVEVDIGYIGVPDLLL